MRILVDQDEVICKWIKRILQYYNEDHGTNFTDADISTWDVTMNLGPSSEPALRAYMRYTEFYKDLEPVDGAIEGMRNLINLGHDVIIVTAVPKCAGMSYNGKIEWLRKNMPFFSLDNFIACKRKDLIKGDVMFDDGFHNIKAFNECSWKEGRAVKSVLFTRPWNEKEVLEPGMKRVSTWEEFLELIRKLIY
jgi:5'(3')-deoxyribonucleotidase